MCNFRVIQGSRRFGETRFAWFVLGSLLREYCCWGISNSYLTPPIAIIHPPGRSFPDVTHSFSLFGVISGLPSSSGSGTFSSFGGVSRTSHVSIFTYFAHISSTFSCLRRMVFAESGDLPQVRNFSTSPPPNLSDNRVRFSASVAITRYF